MNMKYPFYIMYYTVFLTENNTEEFSTTHDNPIPIIMGGGKDDVSIIPVKEDLENLPNEVFDEGIG